MHAYTLLVASDYQERRLSCLPSYIELFPAQTNAACVQYVGLDSPTLRFSQLLSSNGLGRSGPHAMYPLYQDPLPLINPIMGRGVFGNSKALSNTKLCMYVYADLCSGGTEAVYILSTSLHVQCIYTAAVPC